MFETDGNSRQTSSKFLHRAGLPVDGQAQAGRAGGVTLEPGCQVSPVHLADCDAAQRAGSAALESSWKRGHPTLR